MGCGKSKHDVVTGNTTKIRKPLEAESVNGKESQTMERQGSCRCGKRNDFSAVVSGDLQENTVEKNTKKPEEKETTISPPVTATVHENVVREEKETTISPPVTTTVPENVVTEEKKTTTSPTKTAIVPESFVTEEKETTTLPPVTEIAPENVVTEKKEMTTLPPVTEIAPENVVTEETVNNVKESVLPVDEQKEKIDIETVVEEEKNDDDHVDTEAPLPEAEEPKLEVQIPATTVLEVEETMNTENDEIPASKDEDIVEVVKEKPADITKEVESS